MPSKVNDYSYTLRDEDEGKTSYSLSHKEEERLSQAESALVEVAAGYREAWGNADLKTISERSLEAAQIYQFVKSGGIESGSDSLSVADRVTGSKLCKGEEDLRDLIYKEAGIGQDGHPGEKDGRNGYSLSNEEKERLSEMDSALGQVGEGYWRARFNGDSQAINDRTLEAAEIYRYIRDGTAAPGPLTLKDQLAGEALCTRAQMDVSSLLYQEPEDVRNKNQGEKDISAVSGPAAAADQASSAEARETAREIIREATDAARMILENARQLSERLLEKSGLDPAEIRSLREKTEHPGSGDGAAAGEKPEHRANEPDNAAESGRRGSQYNSGQAAEAVERLSYKAELDLWQVNGSRYGLKEQEQDFLAKVSFEMLYDGGGNLASRDFRDSFAQGRIGLDRMPSGARGRRDVRQENLEAYVQAYTAASTGDLKEAETFADWIVRPMRGGKDGKEDLKALVADACGEIAPGAHPDSREFRDAVERIGYLVHSHEETARDRTALYAPGKGGEHWDKVLDLFKDQEQAELKSDAVEHRNELRMMQDRNEGNQVLGFLKTTADTYASVLPGKAGNWWRGRHERRIEEGTHHKLVQEAEKRDEVDQANAEVRLARYEERTESTDRAKEAYQHQDEDYKDALTKYRDEEMSRRELTEHRKARVEAREELKRQEGAQLKDMLAYREAQQKVSINAAVKQRVLNDRRVADEV